MNVEKFLFDNQDIKYRNFHKKLIPTVDENKIIGVRVPVLRKFCKEFYKDKDHILFLNSLPHIYYEENNIHAFLIEQIIDFDECIYRLNQFLPYVDNWATCDSMRPKCFKDNKKLLLNQIKEWILSKEVYTVRFAVLMLMTHFMEEDFNKEYLKTISLIKSDEYYINMMIAWFFQTALAKQWNDSIKYLEDGLLSTWIHNKAIQKAIESRIIPNEKKIYLKSLKVKSVVDNKKI